MRASADGILKIRNEKYPPFPTLRRQYRLRICSLKNFPAEAQAQVPPKVIREGKVPSAYFLEQAGAKGMHRGAIRVADYHANLIYNEGGGTSVDLRNLIDELKARVQERFGLLLEEEVQYVGQPSLVRDKLP